MRKAASAFAFTTPALSLNRVSTPPMLCSSAAPWLMAPPKTTVPASVTGMATVFARLVSWLLILEIPAVTPSFSLTIGVAIILPTAFTLLPTALILSLTISLMATAVTIFLRSGSNRCRSCCAARFAAVASSRAVRRRSQVDSSSRRVRCTSRRKALCSCLILRSTADILSLIEIAPLTTPISGSPPIQVRTFLRVRPRRPA